MTGQDTTAEGQEEEKLGLFARLKARAQHVLAAVEQHCETIEQAKEVCERDNIHKHGKDWVNRCCG